MLSLRGLSADAPNLRTAEASSGIVEISLMLPALDAENLMASAQEQGISLAQMLRRLVAEHLHAADPVAQASN